MTSVVLSLLSLTWLNGRLRFEGESRETLTLVWITIWFWVLWWSASWLPCSNVLALGLVLLCSRAMLLILSLSRTIVRVVSR